MWGKIAPAFVAAVLGGNALAAGADFTVASMGLCADQAVAALLDDRRIAGLSNQAADPAVSVIAARAHHLPTVSPSAEAVIFSRADMVAANEWGDGKTIAMLERLGVPVVRVPSADDLDQAQTILQRLGHQLGAADAAARLTAHMSARRAQLRASRPTAPLLAAYYRPDGGSAGAGTSVNAAMAEAGITSLATRLGQSGWNRLDLETLVMAPPQAFVLSFFTPGDAFSARRAFGRHPLLRRMMADRPVITVPGRLWSCGGWPLVDAAALLARTRQQDGMP